jgi:hypothetical protein
MNATMQLTPTVGNATQAQQWLLEALETGEMDMLCRRHQDPRTTWREPLEVHVCSAGKRTEIHYAKACDIARGGIAFLVRQELPAFTSVLVCRAGEMVGVPAVTVNSTQTLQGFIIGAEFRFETQPVVPVRTAHAG